ncbi:YfjL-like protein [Bacillus sp. SG-1]|uniref:YfjL-like protein n=1 Tax=Bacillus sp. SG-1 TaxID=161544 RepID=UPI0001543B4C|nr:hypothetical protein [Bacillus sp. SG-1]EDL66172.1 hypothetical protein BSG1_02430 [Bacillus sp. SG-1]
MIKKRIFIIIILTLIFSFLIIFYSLFNGIPFGGYIAKAKITDYVEQVYGFDESISKPQFNLKNSAYEVYIPQLENRFSYDLFKKRIIDEKLVNKVNNEFKDDYNKLKNSYEGNIELPDASLFSSILANGEYSNDIEVYQKLYLLGIINRKKITSKESIKMPAKLTKEIIDSLGESYNITSLQVIYTDLNGQYEITLDDKKAISIETLSRNTLKKDQIGVEGKELIRELKEN